MTGKTEHPHEQPAGAAGRFDEKPAAAAPIGGGLLFEGADWNFDTLKRTYDAIEQIAHGELGLDTYRNQIEVITAEQMLDAYASGAMPLMYRHWSFGKRFAQSETLYRTGLQGLALEIVINSNPTVCYVMEENSMTAQATVLAHAAFGHNHFFKNNSVFRQWTEAETILDYLAFAKSYVARCEDRYGHRAVERVLDAAHALGDQGVDRYRRRNRPRIEAERDRMRRRLEHERMTYNDLWRTVPGAGRPASEPQEDPEESVQRHSLALPEENVLYFLEKHAPRLKDWERELIRIVRMISNYFEPQRQTKVMNEGCACWVHYRIMTRLRELGRITEGSLLEFMHLHSSVIFQPGYDDQRYSGLNPYTLGFAIMQDIERICTAPTAEDRDWFPDIAGNGRPEETLRGAWEMFRDESFILQYLSPKVIRDLKLFCLHDDTDDAELVVRAIHDERGYARVRRALAMRHDPAVVHPAIDVVDADFQGDRRLVLQHTMRDGRALNALEARRVLRHLAGLWTYPVVLREVETDSSHVVAEYEVKP